MNELTVVQDMSIESMGDVFVKSGFFADTRDRAQAIVKILAGREVEISPIASMTGVHIVKGKPSMGANLIAACIKNSGRYNYKVVSLSDTECEIEFFERFDIGQSLTKSGSSKFTLADAKRAGTQNLDKFPRNMLFARAMSNGAKWYCASIFAGGVYTPDELGANVKYNEAGEIDKVIDAEVVVEHTSPVEIPATATVPDPVPSDPAKSEPEKPYWHDFEGLTVPDMNLETAMSEKNSKDVLYAELDTATLQHMAREMATILKTGKVKSGPITDKKRDEYQFKLSAIRSILLDRETK